jgi:hypothetical protein
MMRRVNPLVCVRHADDDPTISKQWGLYAADEGLHSRLFAKDLRVLGVSDETLYGTRPLFATEMLVGFCYQTLADRRDLGGLASIAHAYYVETVSSWTWPGMLDRMEQLLGRDCLKGHRAHVALDHREDHPGMVWNLCMRLVKTPADEALFEQYLRKLHSLLFAYMIEVGEVVKGGKPEALPIPAAVVQGLHTARPVAAAT